MSRNAPKYCSQCAQPLVTRLDDDHGTPRERQVCPDAACGFVHWGNPTPVVVALVEHDGDVLLVRNHGWPEKWLGLVSGFLEAGETPEEGVLREVHEELGLEGRVVSLIGLYAFAEANQLLVAYHVEASGEVRLGDELAAYKRVPPDKLKPWPMGTGAAVRDWLARR